MAQQIGFTARKPDQSLQETRCTDADAARIFDSGRGLSMEAATKGTAVLGQTGSGKTASVVLPMADELIGRGCGGVIFDVKGNVRAHMRAIAESHGRLGDVVEFGTSPTARWTDLFGGMGKHERSELISSLATLGVGQENQNMNFLMNGGRIIGDVSRCLRDISQIDPDCEFSKQFRPTLSRIYRVANNFGLAAGVWAYYRELATRVIAACDGRGAEPPEWAVRAEEFIGLVDSDNFHVLRAPDLDRDSRYRDQISYALSHVNNAFSALDASYGLLDRFSYDGPDSVPLDFDDLIYRRRKIVILSFAMDSGRAGEIISKSAKASFYQSVVRNGLAHEGYTFMFADEFQSIVDVSPNSRLNDMDFFSISREFRNINVIATQSVASTRSKAGREASSSLLANCVNKIFLQTADPETEAYLDSMRGDRGRRLRELGRGECVVLTQDDDGRLVEREDSVNRAHARIRGILDNWHEPEAEEAPRPAPPWRVGAAGFPRVIAKALLTPYVVPERRSWSRKTAAKAKAEHAEAVWRALERMREASCRGENFWEVRPEHEQEEDLFPDDCPVLCGS